MPSWAEGKSNEEIQKINTEIQRLCKEDNFEYVDVFDKLIGEDGQFVKRVYRGLEYICRKMPMML